MSRFVVTGGAGLVGSHIVDLLVAEPGSHVVAMDDFSRGRPANLDQAAATGRLEIVEGDVRDRELVEHVLAGADTVFHQAAVRLTQCAEEPRLALDVLATGTFNVVEAAVEAGVRKVIAASSASIYGLAEAFPTGERHHPYNDDTIYGAAKAFGEGILRSFRTMRGLDSVALRYFNVYGPRMDTSGTYTEVLVRWLDRVDAGLAPIVFGDGSETMDLVHVEDVARANILAARSGAVGVFNVGSGRETSLRDLARALIEAMGADLPDEHAPRRTVNPVSRRLADMDHARAALGFEARVGLEEGLRGLVAWWRHQRALADA
jgi:UDP-glucose 4-epimerase